MKNKISTKVTMKDIANKLGLSINAVSLALNDRAGVGENTRKLILDTAENMGYLDQRSKYLPSYSNKNICVLLRTYYFNDMQFYGRILLGLEEAAKEAGYDLLINSFVKDDNIPACVENHKVSGVIVIGKISDKFLIHLKSYSIPVLLVDHTSLLESTDSVLTDNKLGAFKATKYLLDGGFTKIGFFGGVDYSLSVRERYLGYEEALRLGIHFVSYKDLLDYMGTYSLVEDIEKHIINQEISIIEDKISKMTNKPEVFFCSNDKAAILLSRALKNMGYKLPDDISIFGFDDIALADMVVPPISTAHVYKELMGRKAVERLLGRLKDPKGRIEKITMDVNLIIRDSVRFPIEKGESL